MLITFILNISLLFATEWNEETKYEFMLESLRQGQVITCIDDCKTDYGLFLSALDRYYEEDKPERPILAPLYPDSGLLISYYIILKDHFAHLPIPEEIYANIDRQLLNDTDALVPVLRALSESDPFFLRYITWVQDTANKDYNNLSLQDLVAGSRQIESFSNGKYTNGILVFKFCRQDRKFPCRMIVRDRNGRLARTANGKVWSIPTLGMAANGKPYYKVSGDTPSGVYTIDSVMPKADQTRSFGLYRRLILNFIPKADREQNHLYLLPQSHHNQTWWHEAVTGRQVGRNLLRIHGTGKIVTKPTDPFYTFAPTQGCINTRENTYDGITFKDQRLLLDAAMLTMGLPANYANEAKLYGLLYVINVDSRTSPVSAEDLEAWGIK
jgi:hypothetical protein